MGPMSLALITGLVAAVLSSYVSAATEEELDALWLQFKTDYGKQYKDAYEEQYRKANFIENYKLITEHNARFNQGLETYEVKINEFADLSDEEMKTHTGHIPRAPKGVKVPALRDTLLAV